MNSAPELPPILLVEDDIRDVELTLTAFSRNRLANEIVVTRDGVDALDYLYRRGVYAGREEGNPALILLDLNMPRVNGVDLLRIIKRDPDLRTIPVIVLTTSRQDHDQIQSYGLGVLAYVVKPVDFRQVVDAVKVLGGFWAIVEASTTVVNLHTA